MTEALPHVSVLVENMDQINNQILNQLLMNRNCAIRKQAITMLSNLLCITNSQFLKTLKWNFESNSLVTRIVCVECHLNGCTNENTRTEFCKSKLGIEDTIINFSKISVDVSLNNVILKHALTHLAADSITLKVATLALLPSLSSHVKQFHSKSFTTIWAELAGDSSEEVRKSFTKVIGSILKNAHVSIRFLLCV